MEILSLKHFISCFPVNFIVPISVFSTTIFSRNIFIYVKEKQQIEVPGDNI